MGVSLNLSCEGHHISWFTRVHSMTHLQFKHISTCRTHTTYLCVCSLYLHSCNKTVPRQRHTLPLINTQRYRILRHMAACDGDSEITNSPCSLSNTTAPRHSLSCNWSNEGHIIFRFYWNILIYEIILNKHNQKFGCEWKRCLPNSSLLRKLFEPRFSQQCYGFINGSMASLLRMLH
jgi:hypothetical protein